MYVNIVYNYIKRNRSITVNSNLNKVKFIENKIKNKNKINNIIIQRQMTTLTTQTNYHTGFGGGRRPHNFMVLFTLFLGFYEFKKYKNKK